MTTIRTLRMHHRRWPGRDLETFLTVGVAVTMGLLNLLGVVDDRIISTATLSILALVSFHLLGGHRPGRPAESANHGIRQAIGPHQPASEVGPALVARPDTERELPEASDIRLVGVTLNRTVRSHLSALERCLATGGSVRVVVIDQASVAAREAARRNGLPTDAGLFEHRVRPTVDLLRVLSAPPGVADRLQVRLAPFVPSFGLTMIDPDTNHGLVSVEIYSHRPGGEEPLLALTAEHHPHWYRHFQAEFAQIWASARPMALDSGPW
jgi:hypothetical protein